MITMHIHLVGQSTRSGHALRRAPQSALGRLACQSALQAGRSTGCWLEAVFRHERQQRIAPQSLFPMATSRSFTGGSACACASTHVQSAAKSGCCDKAPRGSRHNSCGAALQPDGEQALAWHWHLIKIETCGQPTAQRAR